MIEARWARESEREEIVEFLDYVFSKAHRPHDFASLLPKFYGENGTGTENHFVIREDGKLVAAILCHPFFMRMGGERLTAIGVGSVSTHPVVRGRGYMKLLMDAADERAQEIGADFAVLSGLRQRYERFGYAFGGYQMNAKLTAHNATHALRDVDAGAFSVVPMEPMHIAQAMAMLERQTCFCERSEGAYLDVLRSWNNQPFALLKGGKPAGFGTLRKNPDSTHIAELLLEDEQDFAPAMKTLFGQHGTLTISAAPWQKGRAAWLAGVCQEYHIARNNAFKLYQPERIRRACAAIDASRGEIGFDGFSLPLPLYIAPPDCV